MPSTNLRPENEEELKESDDRKYRQTIMFSATMPLRVELLAKKYLRHPIFISIGDRQGSSSYPCMVFMCTFWKPSAFIFSQGNACETVTQEVQYITDAQKKKCLLEATNHSDLILFLVTFVNMSICYFCNLGSVK